MIFEDDNELERAFYDEYFKPYMESLGLQCVFIYYDKQNGFSDILQREKDIDIIVDDGKENYSFSLKTVKERYSYLFMETISNDAKNTPGWAIYCEADYMIYTMGFPEDLLCYRFPVSSIRGLDLKSDKYKQGAPGITKTREGTVLYKTYGKLVPPEAFAGIKQLVVNNKKIIGKKDIKENKYVCKTCGIYNVKNEGDVCNLCGIAEVGWGEAVF